MKSFKKKHSSMAVSEDSGYCPSISVDNKMIPELEDMKVGDIIELSVKAKITSINKYRSGETQYTLDIEEGEAENEEDEEKPDDETEQETENEAE